MFGFKFYGTDNTELLKVGYHNGDKHEVVLEPNEVLGGVVNLRNSVVLKEFSFVKVKKRV